MTRTLLLLALTVACWWLVEDASFAVSDHEGLLSPFGPVRPLSMVLGALALGLRVFVTFGLVPFAALRLKPKS